MDRLLTNSTTSMSRGGGCTFCLASVLTDLSGLVVPARSDELPPVQFSGSLRHANCHTTA
ncbi:zinc finger protein 239 X3, partial [Biomphalaria glabrata]